MGGKEREGQDSSAGGRARQSSENGGSGNGTEILRARLEKLTDALAAQHRDERKASTEGQEGTASSPGALGNVMSLAFRVLSEFVAAVLVGTAIGWGLDWVFGTSPIFLIVFLLMGAAAGIWNVYRIGIEKPGADTK